jgi:uncharacterized membrane protein YccC
VSIDPGFERAVLAQLVLRERRARTRLRRNRPDAARALAERFHHDVLAGALARVAIEERLRGRRPDGETVSALLLLPDLEVPR